MAEGGTQCALNLDDVTFIGKLANYDPRDPRILVVFNSGKEVRIRANYDDFLKSLLGN